METLAEWYSQQSAYIFSTVAPTTARAYRVAWVHRLAPTLGDLPLDQIDAFVIETAVSQMSGARSTVNDALALLSRLMQRAHRGKRIEGNPVPDVELPRMVTPNPRTRALTPGEFQHLLALIPEGNYRRFVAALGFTGMRFGEAAGLLVADVDIPTRTITVCRQVTVGAHGETRHAVPKSKHSRVVPIPRPFLPSVMDAVEGKDSGALVFPGTRGGYLRYKTLARALDWANLREQVKVFPPGEPGLRFHDLRHTTAGLLFDAGVSAPDVQAVLGHSSLQVTQRYARARADVATRAADSLTALFDEVKPAGEVVTGNAV
ncbi:site-specific integrase [Microbacterium lacticum]|uniref:tyrosine-type recombinase/integrase n=1 Tax=Microbacterium lacticum TaxID=33885 RepID=UPI003A886576